MTDMGQPPDQILASTTPQHNQCLVDVTFMQTMLGADADRQRRYYVKFIQAIKDGLETINLAVNDHISPIIEQECHRLKSNARTIGALPLGEQLEQMEHNYKSMSQDEVLAHAQQLNTLFDQTCTYLQHLGLLDTKP